jgi:hypothetical protein
MTWCAFPGSASFEMRMEGSTKVQSVALLPSKLSHLKSTWFFSQIAAVLFPVPRWGRSGILTFVLSLLLVSAFPALAQVTGAIYTSTGTSTTVNGNLYYAKTSVYLNGGPQNHNDPGLGPDGEYYYQVTDPSGAVLLSADDVSCRVAVVSNGRISGVPSGAAPATCPSGFHPLGTYDPANGQTPVQLCPLTSSPRTDNLSGGSFFDANNWCDTTPNPGGEYKAWVTPISSYNNCAKSNSNIRYGFCDSDSKTDNFKIKKSSVGYINVCKFNDVNGNGIWDANEPLIPGWPLTATGVDTLSGPLGTVNAQTGADGCISFSVSDFTTAHGNVTVTEGFLTGSWRETAPVVGTYTVSDGAVPAGNGTVTVTVSHVGAPPNAQSLTVAAGDNVTLADFGNTCLDSSCGGNSIDLTVTTDANPSLTRTYTWGITKSIDNATVQSVSGGQSSPANYTVTVTHNTGTASGWELTGTIKVTNASWVDVGGVNVTDAVNNGAACVATDADGGLNLTIPAKSEVDVPFMCTYSALPANGTDTATATWNSGTTTPGKAMGTAAVNFGSPAIKVVDGSVTVTDKLDNSAPVTLGAPSYSDASPITYTYSHTFTDPAGTCTSHTNTASFTTNTTHATGNASATVQDCQTPKPPSLTCAAVNTGTVGVAFSSGTITVSGGTAPFTFSVVGTLPAGLTLNTSTGAITGTPLAVGTFSIKVTDSKGVVGTGNCPFTIKPNPLSITCAAVKTGTVGLWFSSGSMAASGGTAPYSYSVVGTLPAGLTLNTSTGAVTGTPTAKGTFSIKVTDAKGASNTSCQITINPGTTTGEIDCWNANFAYGYNYQCDANNDSGTFQGYMTYTYDGGAPVTVPMNASGHSLFTITLPVVGTHTVIVSYPAQGNYLGYTLPPNVFTVTPAQVHIAINPSAWYAPAGTVITLTVPLLSDSAGAPIKIGTVSFYDGTTLLGTVAVDATGKAGISTGALSTGYHTITAKYSGGGNFAPATGSAVIQIGGSILSWATPAAITYGTPLSSTQLNATATVPGTFVYAPVAGTKPAVGPQTLKITFTPTDTKNYVVQTATVPLTVNQAPQTITFTTPLSGQVNAKITLNGTGGASGNPVTYTVTGPATLSGATLTLTGLGTVTVTANQAGNSNYLAATPVTQTILVSNSTSNATITLIAAGNTLTYPGAENLVACVTLASKAMPSGTITIYDGATLVTTQPISGNNCLYWWTTPSLQAGTHQLKAVYNDATNKNVTSAMLTITVNPGTPTGQVVCYNSTFSYGLNYQCDANNNTGVFQGSMTYSYDGGAPVTVPMNAAGHVLFTISLPVVGTHNVKVAFVQQANWNSYILPVQTFTVTPAPVSVTLTPSSWNPTAGTSLTITAAVSSTTAGAPKSTGSISFYDGATLLSTVAVNANGTAAYTTSSLAVGTYTIKASYAGGVNYGTGSISNNIVVAPK